MEWMMMRKTKLKRKSKSPIRKVQDKLWELCKQITRLEHGDVCYTCYKSDLIGSNWHTGHMWAKASLGAHLKYDLRVLRPQCFHCNINLGGMGADFYSRMKLEKGDFFMEGLEKERQILVKADVLFYQKKVDKYEKVLSKLKKKKK